MLDDYVAAHPATPGLQAQLETTLQRLGIALWPDLLRVEAVCHQRAPTLGALTPLHRVSCLAFEKDSGYRALATAA